MSCTPLAPFHHHGVPCPARPCAVRDAAHAQRASRLQQERAEYLERCVPAVPAAPGYWVHVRSLTGHTYHVAAHPEWTILNLKAGESIAYPSWMISVPPAS